MKRGFTLIELLVVIAIIGTLASVVLASLNSARTKASDAAIKSMMEELHKQAEIYHLINNTYNSGSAVGNDDIGECTTYANTIFDNTDQDSVTKIFSAAQSESSKSGNNRVLCYAYSDSWAAAAPLIDPSGSNTGWCVDSSGASKEVNVNFDVGGGAQLRSGGVAFCP
jgi:prepilin-type N-terminal cleavage/methylation domain-containing protein